MSESKRDTRSIVYSNLTKRYRREKIFRALGLSAVLFGISCVALLFFDIFNKGIGAFHNHWIQVEVKYDADKLGLDLANLDDNAILGANYDAVVRQALIDALGAENLSRTERRELMGLLSSGAADQLRDDLIDDKQLIGSARTLWLLADDKVDTLMKLGGPDDESAKSQVRLSDAQYQWIGKLAADNNIERHFNWLFFSHGDSREPELAGIKGAIVGSALTLLVTLILSFPMGVAAAIYLEEFAPKNYLTDFIEVNINNLAAVPSIIFGLLGLAVFIGFFGLPRSVPLVGGLVLTFMTLPTIIISSRAAIKSVPPSIREAALGMGASPVQTVFHHVLPLAMPGMLTGAIIGMARALGETAPLLMIGMVAFVVNVPGSIVDPSTVLPVQVFLWADSPERAFVERTSAAIMVLLVFLIVMNGAAVWLRNKLERRW